MVARKSVASKRAVSSASVSLPQSAFFDDVRSILQQARRKAYAVSNFIMVEAYWQIGQRIVREEQGGKDRADYGHYLIRNLAHQLGDEFGKGLSIANLWNFRQFYLTFPAAEKLYALRRELSWTHWRLLMRVENPAARDYYIHEAAEQGWTTRLLERNIATLAYERLLAQPGATVSEAALVLRLRDFLMELGKGFSFVGRQFRVSTETSHFYVDLVFYNYLLKCFVLIDLKTRKLTHADIGQPGLPLYLQVSRDGCVLHLSEHHGDCSPGAALRIETADLDGLHAELLKKAYKFARPGIEATPWGSRDLSVTDPFGNRLTFTSASNA